VLQRVAPVLRHDVAGLMQPIGMMTKILQRRVQAPVPDLLEISKNLASVGALAKEASSGCMNAIGWMVSSEDQPANLSLSVNTVTNILSAEFSSAALTLTNDIEDEQISVPQLFVRSLLIGALLAFCDQRTPGDILQITLKAAGQSSDTGDMAAALMLRMLSSNQLGALDTPDLANSANSRDSADTQRQSRLIEWCDVQALADAFHVTMTRGEGWLILGLPHPLEDF
jgi:hypothetical protein